MTNSPITPIDYSSRDYSSLINDIRTIAPLLLPEWTNQSDADFGVVLLDLFAYVGDIMSYYIDRVANEAFLGTATRRQSILNLADMFNYIPIAASAATVLLQFTTATGSPSITIPALTKVSTFTNDLTKQIIFETNTDLIIGGVSAATPQYVSYVLATQGQTIHKEVLTSSADGSPAQSYTLFNQGVLNDSIVIDTVDALAVETEWHSINTLLNATGAERAYEASIDDNDIVHINFGDNYHGRIPTAGSLITATYRIGDGTAGNVSANQLTEMVSPISGVVKVTNLSPATGGVDPESTDSIRATIPQSLYALNRAVTLDDYAALAVQVPGVAKAQATAMVYTSVLLYIAPVGGGPGALATGPDTTPGTLEYYVQQYLSDKKLINVSVSFAQATYVPVNISATVYVLPAFFQKTVTAAVTSALQSLLAFTNVDFNTNITQSKVFHTIQNVEGVDYVALTNLSRTGIGLGDVTINVGEIPTLGALSLTMSGGVV